MLRCTILRVPSRRDLGLQCPPLRSSASPRAAPHAAAFVPLPPTPHPRGVRVPAPRAAPRPAPIGRLAPHRTAPALGARGSRPPAGSVQRSRCGAAPRRAVGWRERGKRGAGCCCVPPPTPRRGLLSFGVILGEIMLSPCGLGPFSHPGIQQGLGDGAVCCSPAAEHSAGMSPSHLCFAHGFDFSGSQCVFTFPCVKYRLLQTAAVIAVIHISYQVFAGLCVGFWGCTAPCHRDGETPPQGGREPADTVCGMWMGRGCGRGAVTSPQ